MENKVISDKEKVKKQSVSDEKFSPDKKVESQKEKGKNENVLNGEVSVSKEKGRESSQKKENNWFTRGNDDKKHGPDVIGAIFMIFLGMIFLMNSFDILPWSVWSVLWRFWPVLLILNGLQLILGRSWISRIFTGFVAVIAFNLILLVSILTINSSFDSVLGGVIGDYRVARLKTLLNLDASRDQLTSTLAVREEDAEDVELRNVKLNIGAAEFTVESGDEKDFLTVRSEYYEGFNEPGLESNADNGVLNVEFDTESKPMFLFGWYGEATHDFTFGQSELKTDLEIDLGAGNGMVSPTSLNLNDLKVNIGAGKVDFIFTDDSIPQGDFKLDVGAGSSKITLPEDVGLKVVYDVGAGSLSVDDEEFEGLGKDGTYESDGYDNAEVQVVMEVKVGAGKVEIVRK